MTQWMPILLDVLLMIAVFVVVLQAARKGFVAAMVDLVGYIASLIGAWILGKLLAQWIFDAVLRLTLLKWVRGTIDANFTMEQLGEELEKVIGELPRVLSNSLSFQLDQVTSRFETELATGAMDLTESFTDLILGPTVVGLMQIILFLILFSFLLFLVHVLSGLLRELRHLPVIGPANSFLGGMVGFVEAILLVFAFTTVLHLIFTLTNDSIPWLCSDTVRSNNILSKLYQYNPLLR